MASTGQRRPLLAIVATLIGLAIALLMVEGLVRLVYDEAVQPRFVIDSGYGIRSNQPNVDTRHYVPGDYDVAITTNADGLRGPRRYPVERVPGKRRVLILGDSFPFGYGVEDGEVVSAVLEDRLNDARPGRWEVVNLAVSGFGQAEELVTWEARGQAFKPDVVVMFYFDNDIGNNAVSQLYTPAADGGVTRTGRAFLPGSNLQQAMFAIPPVRWLFEHSQAWNLIRNRLSSLVQRKLIKDQGLKDYGDATPASLALTRGLVRQFARDVIAAGAQPIIVLIPVKQTLLSNFPLTPDETAALGVTLIDGRTFVDRSDYYDRDNHWRASGHRKAAERLQSVIAGMFAD